MSSSAFDKSTLTQRSPPTGGTVAYGNTRKVYPKIPPDYVNTHKIIDFRDRNHATKQIDNCTDMQGWTSEGLRQFIYGMRGVVIGGYGTGKNLIGDWGLIKYEKIYKALKNSTDAEIVAKGIDAFARLSNWSHNQLLALASRYRFLDYKRVTSNHESLDGYCPAEYGFNPYRLSPRTVDQIKNTQYGYRFLRCNEATGIFECPELDQAVTDGKSVEDLIALNELKGELASLKQRDTNKSKRIVELGIQNKRLSDQLETVSSIFTPGRNVPSNSQASEPPQLAQVAQTTEATQSGPNQASGPAGPPPFEQRPHNGTRDDKVEVVDQHINASSSRTVLPPSKDTGPNDYTPSMHFSRTTAVKNQRLSNQLESVNQIFSPNRNGPASTPLSDPQQSNRVVQGTEAPDTDNNRVPVSTAPLPSAHQPRDDTPDDDIMVVEQPPSTNNNRIVGQPIRVTGPNDYIPSMNFSRTTATLYGEYNTSKNHNPQLQEWCSYCKGYVGHHGGRGPGGCPIKRIKKPTGCWWCGRPGHQKISCKNERVPGAGWNPGHEPVPGRPRPGFNGNTQGFASYNPDRENKSNRIFARTPSENQSDKDIVDEKAPDCVKIMARGFQKAFATPDDPLGYPALNGAYYRAKQVEEQDLLRRENDNFLYIMRRVRSWLVEKEKAMNSFIIRDIDKEEADELKVKLDDDSIDHERTKLEIVKYIKKLVNIDLPSTDEIAEFRFTQRQVTEKDAEGNETLMFKCNLRVELIDRAWVKRILIKSAKIANDDSGPLPTELYTLEEVKNDAYVLKNVNS